MLPSLGRAKKVQFVICKLKNNTKLGDGDGIAETSTVKLVSNFISLKFFFKTFIYYLLEHKLVNKHKVYIKLNKSYPMIKS